MEEKEIKVLLVKMYNFKIKVYMEDYEGLGCRVCLFLFKSGDKFCILFCKYDYYVVCVKEWLKVGFILSY